MKDRWIFLRGLMRESRHWGAFPEQFRRYAGGAQLLLPDLAGNGRLHAQRSPACVQDMVEHYRAAVTAQGLQPPYHLLALSLGAMMAIEWAQRYPDELAGCVLMNTSLRPFSPFYRRLRWQNYPVLVRLATAGRDVQTRERIVLRLTSNRGGAHMQTLRAWIAYQRECPVSRANAMRQLLAAASYRAPGSSPRVPMLVLASAGDRLVDPSCSHRLAEAWGCSFAMHPDAGHDLALDDGEWVAAQVRDWLGQIRA
ncbi:MAG TPA: alpha/beta hydrolase [Noviherbaspirillum sp.]|nr:alpha/beta hydrolase [Noviherbaspirillum sp.]